LTQNDTPDAALLPDGWVWTTIGDITQPVEKVKPADDPDKEFAYLDISSIDNSINTITAPKVYRGADAPSRARQLVRASDVLFSTVRTYLKNIASVPGQYDGQIASTGFSVLRGEDGISGKYLFYFTLTDDFIATVTALQRGVSYPAVRDADVRSRWIPLAPPSEQHRIVDAIETQFTRLDAAVAALERARANVERYRASVLHAACEGRLVPTEAELARRESRDYEPADELLARILEARRARWEEERWEKEVERAKKKAAQAERKAAGLPYYMRDLEPEDWEHRTLEDSEPYLPKSDKWKEKYDEPEPPETPGLPAPPEGWVWATLEQVSERIVDCLHSTPEFASRGKYCVDTNSMERGGIRLDMARFVSEATFDERTKRLKPEEGDIVFAREGTIGTAAQVPPGVELCLGQRVMMYRPARGVLSGYFMWAMLSPAFEAQWRPAVTGTTAPHVNIRDLRGMSLPVPPLAEQHRIVEEVEQRLSVVQAMEKAVEASLARAERLRQAILKKAFEGRLVPQDPGDEPASALLERIRDSRKAAKSPR
jgi:type I restriction enzyme S subunit